MPSKGFLRNGPNNIGLQAGIWDPALPTTRNPSNNLWSGYPGGVQATDNLPVFELYDDFFGIVTGAQNWINTQATSGTATAGILLGGTVALNSGATTLHQGIQIQKAGGHFVPTVSKSMWFECSLQVNRLQGEFFFGLADIDATLIATGALHATDCIGFKSVTADGVLLPVNGSGSVYTTGTTVGTLVAATNIQLGFVISSNTSIAYYVNGVQVGASVTTNIPSVVLSPSFVSQAGAAAAGNVQVDLDWVQCAQLR